MGIVDEIRRQLRTVIEWENPESNDLIYNWTENGDEIKNASKLVVGPGQGCIFIYRGKVKGTFDSEGVYDLKTQNIPFWTSISRFIQFFESEHKSGFYFYKKTRILNQKWGTSSPIKYVDPHYNFPVGLKAYGNFSFQISNAEYFFTSIVGDRSSYTITDFQQVMLSRLIQTLSDHFAESKYSYAEIDGKRIEVAQEMLTQLDSDFKKLGFKVTDFRIEGTDFDVDTIERISKIADITADAHAAQNIGVSYKDLQQIQAMRDAAQNEGGGAGVGMSMGAGMGFGQMMSDSMNNSSSQANIGQIISTEERLQKLKSLYDKELITAEEYTKKKDEILDSL